MISNARNISSQCTCHLPFSVCNSDKLLPCVDVAQADVVVDMGEWHSESLEDGCTAPYCEEGGTGKRLERAPTAEEEEGADMTLPCRVGVRSEVGVFPEAR